VSPRALYAISRRQHARPSSGAPDGQDGFWSAHVCTKRFGRSSSTYVPRTPPPKSVYAPPFSGADVAGARVHIGMRAASVSSEKRSSAAAMNVALARTTAVCALLFAGTFGEGAAAAAVADGPGPGVEMDEAVVVFATTPACEAPPCTSRSFPCVSSIARGSSAKTASSAAGNSRFARAYSALTAGADAVVRTHSYCVRR
jgi:hypothetical protein